MNMKAEKKKTKLKINIIDFLIIITLIAVAVGIAWRYDLASRIGFNSRNETFDLIVIIRNIQTHSQDFLQPDSDVFVGMEDLKIGRITEIVDIRPAIVDSVIFDEETGRMKIVRSEYSDERMDIILRIESEGSITSEDKHMINGIIYVASGSEFFIHTWGVEANIVVLRVEPH
jgi:hypothetical protein